MVGILLLLLVIASITDIRWGRIPNWVTYSGMALALGLNAIGGVACRLGWSKPEWLADCGWIGIGAALWGFLVCGLVMLACYVLFRIGGGDVKLVAMMGAFLGPERGITAMLWTFVLGASLALIVLVWRIGVLRLVRQVGSHLLWSLRLGRFDPLTPEERAVLQPPLFLAPAALVATVVVWLELAEQVLQA